jgi:hypothetical protein
VTEIRTLDTQLKANAQAIAQLVAATGSTLTEVVGVGPIMAGRLISRTGRASRFVTASAFANEVPASSLAPRASATQLRPPHHRHHPNPHTQQPRPPLLQEQDRRGKNTTRGGTVPQKMPRRLPLADHDQRRTAGGRSREDNWGRLQSSVAGPTPMTNASDKSLPGLPTTTLRRPNQPLDKHRGTQGQQPRQPLPGTRHPRHTRTQRTPPERPRLRHPGSPFRQRNSHHTDPLREPPKRGANALMTLTSCIDS